MFFKNHPIPMIYCFWEAREQRVEYKEIIYSGSNLIYTYAATQSVLLYVVKARLPAFCLSSLLCKLYLVIICL